MSKKSIGICELCAREATCRDHSHYTGRCRGILCVTCNISLGFYETRKARGIANSDSQFDAYIYRYAQMHEAGLCAIYKEHEIRDKSKMRASLRRYYHRKKADAVWRAARNAKQREKHRAKRRAANGELFS